MSGKKIIYRRMTAEDIPYLMPAFKEYWAESQEPPLTEDIATNWLGWYIQTVGSPASLMLGAFSGKRVAGFTCVFPMASFEDKPWAFIDPFYVVKEYRNGGIGLKMWEVCEQWTKQGGFVKMLATEQPDKPLWSRKKKLGGFKPYRNLLIREV